MNKHQIEKEIARYSQRLLELQKGVDTLIDAYPTASSIAVKIGCKIIRTQCADQKASLRKLAVQATGISAVLATQDDALYDMILATIDSMENNIETKQAALQYADEINNQITQRLIELHMRK